MGVKHFEVVACYSLAFVLGFLMLLLDATRALTACLVIFVPLGSERRNIYLQDFGGGAAVAGGENQLLEQLPSEITLGSVAPWLCVF